MHSPVVCLGRRALRQVAAPVQQARPGLRRGRRPRNPVVMAVGDAGRRDLVCLGPAQPLDTAAQGQRKALQPHNKVQNPSLLPSSLALYPAVLLCCLPSPLQPSSLQSVKRSLTTPQPLPTFVGTSPSTCILSPCSSPPTHTSTASSPPPPPPPPSPTSLVW